MCSTPDWISAISNAVLAVAAWRGVSTWRQQLRGNAEFDAAREFKKASLRVKDFVRYVRSPVVFSIPATGRGPEHKDLTAALVSAYEGRWQKYSDGMTNLELAADEARVFWEIRVDELMKPFRAVANDLRVLLDEFHEVRDERVHHDERKIARDRFYAKADGSDPLSRVVADACEAVSTFTAPLLAAKSTTSPRASKPLKLTRSPLR